MVILGVLLLSFITAVIVIPIMQAKKAKNAVVHLNINQDQELTPAPTSRALTGD